MQRLFWVSTHPKVGEHWALEQVVFKQGIGVKRQPSEDEAVFKHWSDVHKLLSSHTRNV